MSIRTVTKALAGKEDLLLGNTQHTQQRAGQDVTVTGISGESLPLGDVAGVTVSEAIRDPAIKTAGIAIAGATDIIELEDIKGFQTNFGGILSVVAADSYPLDGAARNSATYLLLIDKGVSGGTVVSVASGGLTTGSVATDPSFTWSLNGSWLSATPIGSTSGTFYFEVVSPGPNLKLKG